MAKASQKFSRELEDKLVPGRKYDIYHESGVGVAKKAGSFIEKGEATGIASMLDGAVYLGVDGDQSDSVVRMFSCTWKENGFICVRIERIPDDSFSDGTAKFRAAGG
ncbi:MAG TPA: hypothetical protein VGR81_13320 [Candidatus Acidoferrales bacterium]|nr:hypothetical protein [Candidatus Acidoferrales bacterium]